MPDTCVWNKCNNRCIMCTNSESFQKDDNSGDYTFERVIERVGRDRDYYERSGDSVTLTGGEPTIHPRFIDIISQIRSNLPINRMMIASNGRRFCYPSFVDEVSRVDHITWEIAVHGWNAGLHDAVTRVPGSFDQTMAGIGNLIRRKNPTHEVEIRIIVLKQNYEHLSKICELINDRFPSINRLVIIYQEIEGVCEDNLKLVNVRHDEVREAVERTADKWGSVFGDFRLYHFPLCTISPRYWKYVWRTLRSEEVFHPSVCEECLYKKYCLGVHHGYHEFIGEDDFRPIKKELKLKTNEDHYYHPILDVED